MDHLHTLNDLTPKIKCNGKKGVDPDVLFGIDTKLFSTHQESLNVDGSHNEEVETITLWRGTSRPTKTVGCCEHAHEPSHHCMAEASSGPKLNDVLLRASLDSVLKESVWRIKGFVRFATPPSTYIVNWAFGRVELTPFEDGVSSKADVRLTVMGERGEVKRAIAGLAKAIGAAIL